MTRSVRTAIGSVLLIALIGAGYFCGRSAGARVRHRPERAHAPWNPEVDFDDSSAPAVPANEVFASVLDKVQHDFVSTPDAGRITNSQITDGALSSMLSSLHDPHTFYLTPEECARRTNALMGRVAGIGATFAVVTTHAKGQDVDYRYLTVRSIARGGPAERVGLIPGDRITEINGQWIIAYTFAANSSRSLPDLSKSDPAESQRASETAIRPGLSASRAIDMLTSGTGKTLRLTVDRRGAQQHIDVTTAQTLVPSAEHTVIASRVTYLRINAFNTSASVSIDAALRSNQDWARGLIIDLRQNSGGVEAEPGTQVDGYSCAMKLISYVARRSTVGIVERVPGERRHVTVLSSRPAQAASAHVIVLVDSGTSNIAELAACGMRDAGDAVLVGSRTAGDDVLTHFTPLESGGAVEMAAAHLYTAAGVDLKEGVKPDYNAQTRRANRADDPAISRARRLLGV